jgi:hypothetical protein
MDIEQYPEVKVYLEKYLLKLEARAGKQLWWQLQGTLASYEVFEKPKIIYPDIIWKPQFSLSKNYVYLLNTSYFCSSVKFTASLGLYVEELCTRKG